MPQALTQLLHRLRRLRAPCPDRVLLDRFVRSRDEAAFTALVSRHGPLVFRLCRRLLRKEQDVEDAFQATFLVLARRASAIRRRDSLAAWLHGVTYRVASRLRAANSRQHQREAPSSDLTPPDPHPDPLTELTAREALRAIDEEVGRLPEAYRLPVIFCCLEGLSQEEAARRLGWSPGSVKGRLERGRKRLHQLLARRGLSLAAALALAEVSRIGAAGPAGWLRAVTAKAAVAFAAGASDPGVPAEVLAEGELRCVALAKGKLGLLLLLAAGTVIAGSARWAQQVPAREQPKVRPAEEPHRPTQGVGQAKSPNKDELARTDRHGDLLPSGALERFGTVRLRHAVGRALAFSPDGKTATSAGVDRTLRVWEVASGRLLRKLPGPCVNDILDVTACSTDGSTLVTVQRDPAALVFWDLATGQQRRTLAWNGARPGSLAFSRDGHTLAVAPEDGTLHLLDAESGTRRLPPLRHRAGSRHLTFSPDGTTIAAGGETNGPIELWDTATGKHLRKVPTKDYKLAFSPDGKWFASAGRGGEVTLWDQATGTAKDALPLPPPAKYFRPVCLAFSRDGKLLAAGGDGRPVIVWDFAARKELHRLPVGWATALLFSPDGRVLGTSANSTIRLWDLKTGRELHPREGHAGEVNGVAVSADGRVVASGSWEDYTVRLWDRETGRQRRVLAGHTDYVRAIAPSPDGKTLFSGSGDGTIRQWDLASGDQLRAFTLNGPEPEEKRQVCAFSPSEDGKTLVGVGVGFDRHDQMFLRGWDVATGRELVNRRVTVTPEWALSMCLSPDVKTLATIRKGKLVLEEVASGRHRVLPADGLLGDPLAYSPDGKLLGVGLFAPDPRPNVHGGEARAIALYDLERGGPARVVETGPVGVLAFSPDRRYLATASQGSLRLWELATGREVLRRPSAEQFRGMHGNAFISSLAFTPDGRGLVTGMPDTTVLLWGLTPAAEAIRGQGAEPGVAALRRWWSDLGSEDGPRGHAAVWALARAPRENAIAFLKQQLRPAPGVDGQRVRQLIADLDSGEFGVRQAAFQELEKLGEGARPAIRRALDSKPSPEAGKRLQELLARSNLLHSGEVLRAVRAVQVLELIGTAEARRVLEVLAKGAAEARLTQEAKVSLGRMSRRAVTRP
jgi:RNA polymerase sigma factor (sigma-70 family)